MLQRARTQPVNMNKPKNFLIIACLIVGVAVAKAAIEWSQPPLIELVKPDGLKIQLGLRDDGVVVWRKITNTTNSPAENKNNIWKYSVDPALFFTNTPTPFNQIIPLNGR